MDITLNKLRYIKKKILGSKERFIPSIYKLFYSLPEISLESIVEDDIKININDLIYEDSCMPPLNDSLKHDDYTPLLKIILSKKPKTVFEFGTALGNTTANICKFLPGVRVYTVNALPEQMNGKYTTYSLRKDEIGKIYKSKGYSHQVIQIFEDSKNLNVSDYIDNKKIDIAIIDACHDTDFVINDFLKIEPHISNNGFILLHDTHSSMNEHLVGSYYACMKLRAKGFDIKHIKDTWWGFFEKK